MTPAGMTLPRLVRERLTQSSIAMDVLLVVAAANLIALASQIAIPVPFSPVPMTLQPLAVLLVGASLGSSRGFAAAVAYLFEGASGLPVFAGLSGGIHVLVGPTAGFLFAFPAAAWIAGLFSERSWGQSVLRTAAAMTLALATIHVAGWAWLAFAWHAGATGAFVAGNAPFLLSDVFKLAIATAILPSAQHFIQKMYRTEV